MIWADKLAVALFALVAFLLLLMGLGPAPPAYADITPAEHWGAGLSILWFLGTRYLVPIWLVLRLIDFLAGGPARRHGRVKARWLN